MALNIGQAIGAAVNGAARGYGLGSAIKSQVDDRKYRQEMSDVFKDLSEPEQVGDAGAMQTPDFNPNAKEDKQQQSLSRGKRLKGVLNRAMDTAAKYGRQEDAMRYFQATFGIEERMIKEQLPSAMRQFQTTGDVTGFVSLYNDAYDDNHQISGVDRDEEGNYIIKSLGPNGQERQQVMSRDQIGGLISTFDNPAARWQMKAKAAEERRQAILKHQIDLSLENAKLQNKIKENDSKPFTLSEGQKRFDNEGKEVASVEPKKDTSLNETELVMQAANGDPQLALKMIVDQKQRVARAGRAPVKQSSDERAFASWKRKSANQGKGYDDFLKEKANWKETSAGLETVTTSKEIFGEDGITKETRSRKVKPMASERAEYEARMKAYEGNPKMQAKLTAYAKEKGIIE